MNFLPPRFTVGEAQDLGRWYTCSDELAPLWDKSVECMSQCLQEPAHTPIESGTPVQEDLAQPETFAKSEAPIKVAEQVVVESINSETKSDRGEDMVAKKTMTIDRFVPGTRQTVQ